jgi:two-component system cell cycle response regulator
LIRQFNHTEVLSIADLAARGSDVQTLLRQMRAAGLTHMTRLLLTSRRSGLWAWSGGGSPQAVNQNLESLRSQAKDLVENAESYERIEEMSYTDGLTGLANQRYFHKRLREEIDRAKRYRRSLALIIFDLDDLKSINDTYGHLAGDAVLRRLGQILRGSIRAIDVIARYGGDEFCVIMPEADRATCERFMQRLQEKISSSQFAVKEIEGDAHRTISQGGAVYPEHGDSYARLLEAADAALLRAKETGRNKYLLYDSADQPTEA